MSTALGTDEQITTVDALDGTASTRSWAKPAMVAADAAMVVLALIAAYVVRANQGGEDIEGAALAHLAVGILGVPVWVGLLARQRLYNARFITRRIEELRRIIRGSGAAVMLLAAIVFAGKLPVSRLWLICVGAFSVAFLLVEREIARRIFARLRRQGRMMRDVVIVGSDAEAMEFAEMLWDDPTLGYRVVGFASDEHAEGREDFFGTLGETLDVVRRTRATGVILAASATSISVSNPMVRDLVNAAIHVELSSNLRDVAPERLTVRPLGRVPVVYLEPPRTGGWRSFAKRGFDLLLASVGILLILPMWIAVAMAIKLDSRGPIFFKQVRVGKDGKPFQVWKFRTMVSDAEFLLDELLDRNEADGPLFKLKEDPRVTRVGNLLRKSSLDELPQLINVLQGRMSLVGPRPALPTEVSNWDSQLHSRLRVKPGITGMWQVSGRSDSSFEAYTRLDLYYVDNWSLLTDLIILAKTVPTVLLGRGAY